MIASTLKKLVKKSPAELIRFLTVEQWRAIDREYLEVPAEGDETPPASATKTRTKKKKGRAKKGAKTSRAAAVASPSAERYSLRPLITGVVVAVLLSVSVYSAGIQSQRFWFGFHLLGYVIPMVLVLWAFPKPRASHHAKVGKLLWLPLIVIGLIALSLTMQELYGERGLYARLYQYRSKYYELHSFAWWTGWRFLGYLVFPALCILVLPGIRLRDVFVSTKNFRKHLWIYVGLFLLVLPAVLVAAQTKSFKLTYPFYKLANRSSLDFWAWQGLYWLQFISLEFFFRGFILRALAPRFGSSAVFVMIVPYCMIHFGKPLSETLGAIIAGLVLGTLAMRTKSIWGGAFIHIAVALTMDSLAVSDCPSADSGLRCPSH